MMTKEAFLRKSQNIEFGKYNKILANAFKKNGFMREGADDFSVHFFDERNKDTFLGLMYDACDPEIIGYEKQEVWSGLLDKMPKIFNLENVGKIWNVAGDFIEEAKKFHLERAPDAMIKRAQSVKLAKENSRGGGRGYSDSLE